MSTRTASLLFGLGCLVVGAVGALSWAAYGFAPGSAFLTVVGLIGLPLAAMLAIASSRETFPDPLSGRPGTGRSPRGGAGGS